MATVVTKGQSAFFLIVVGEAFLAAKLSVPRDEPAGAVVTKGQRSFFLIVGVGM